MPLLLKSNEEDALAMLWDETLSVDDTPKDLITQSISKRFVNDLKRPSFVMVFQVFDVLQNKGGRTVEVNDLSKGKE